MKPLLVFTLGLGLAHAPEARGGPSGATVRETAEYLIAKFGKAAAADGAEALSRRVARAAAAHGDDAVLAIKNVGPKGLRLIEEAGEHAPQAVRAMARYGEQGAIAIAARPSALKLVSRYGDDAAAACVRHIGVAEPLIEKFGQSGVKALASVGPQGGRRLAMLHEAGELARIGRTEELLAVVARLGDTALDFVWRNKMSLMTAAGLAVFLAEPEKCIAGAVDLSKVAADAAIKPLAESSGRAIEQAAAAVTPTIASGPNWAMLLAVVVVFGAGGAGCSAAFTAWQIRRRKPSPTHVPTHRENA